MADGIERGFPNAAGGDDLRRPQPADGL